LQPANECAALAPTLTSEASSRAVGVIETARHWSAEIEAAVAFALTCLAYSLGAAQSLDYDSSITVGYFVATPSLLDPFRREHGFNNHPLFSFADHLVYSLGGRGEVPLRALPIIFGAATVAILAWWCARRWGVLAGAAAAIVTASNPLFASLSREVRGYSLLSLCALLSTLLFLRLSTRDRTRSGGIAYVVALAVGIGAHLYGLFLIPLQAAVVISRRELTRTWLIRWASAAVLGGLAYIGIVRQLWAERGLGKGSGVIPGFPLDLAKSLLGTHAIAVIATLLLIAGAVAACWPPKRAVVSALGVLAGLIVGTWLVVQPFYLFPRFFVWLVPAIAFLAARAVARWPLAIVLALACLVSTALYEGGTWTEDPLPTRSAAHILSAAATQGLQPCVLGVYGESLAAYSPPRFRDVFSASQLAGCDVTLQLKGWGVFFPQVRVLLPYRTVLRGQSSFYIYSRRPLDTLLQSLQALRRS
jgi:hypothetical protein